MDIRRRNIGASIKGTTGGGSSSSGTYTINLNGQWEKTTAVSNPDSSLYDGVYRSSSSYNVNNGVSIMYITIRDCSTFKMYIRSFAESNYDYVMVSQLDKSINGSTSYSDTTLVKAHTRGNQQPGTALSSYTLVEYTGISSGEHTITVVYRKDSSVNTDDDRGYVLIPKMDGNGSDSGGESGGSGDINNYLTIVALEDGLTASLSNNACEYCIDGDGNWLSLAAGATTQSVNTGHTLSFRGNLPSSAGSGIGTFTISKKCNLEGNCMSMKFGDNVASNNSLSGYYTLARLFGNCTNIISVSNNFLPATTLAENCYYYMFAGCTNLISAPELPATTLGASCCRYMFLNCTSLTTAPELPATTLASLCYESMFKGCTSLTTAPALPATTLGDSCYGYMFSGCTNLTTVPELPATTLAVSCYANMFSDCTSLTVAPILPATKLEFHCYSYMVSNTNVLPDCSNIDFSSTAVVTSGGLAGLFANTKVTDADLFNILPINSNGKYYLPSSSLSKESYKDMFYNCTNLVTAPDIMASTAEYYCCSGMFRGCINLLYPPRIPTNITSSAWSCFNSMFSGCKKLIAAPELPSPTLSDACYANMFYGCIALTEAPELPATTLSENCYKQMFEGCRNITVAPTLPALNLKTHCYIRMFQGCNKLNYIKMLATNISASRCLENWVSSVASSGTFIKHPDMTSLPTGISGIPSGWTVQDASLTGGAN